MTQLHILRERPNFKALYYIDTVEVYFRSIPPVLRRQEQWLKRCRGNDGALWGWRYYINQPTEADFQLLKTLEHNGHWFSLSRVDIAEDTITPTQQEAEAVAEDKRRHAILRFKRRRHRFSQIETTTYWAGRRCSKNLALYADKPSRHGLGPCAHLELRLLGSAAVRRAGLTIDTLLTGDLSEIFARHVHYAADFDATNVTRRHIRRTLNAEREQHLASPRKRSPTSERFRERWRAALPGRDEYYLRRLGFDTAQWAQDRGCRVISPTYGSTRSKNLMNSKNPQPSITIRRLSDTTTESHLQQSPTVGDLEIPMRGLYMLLFDDVE